VDAQSRYVIEFQLQIAFNFSTFWSDFLSGCLDANHWAAIGFL
jgi:hypothetical protein